LQRRDDEALALPGLQWNVGDSLAPRRARPGEAHWETSGPSVRLDRFERLVRLVLDASREHDPDADPMVFVERLIALARPHRYPPHDRLPNRTRADSLLPFLVEPYGIDLLEGPRVLAGTAASRSPTRSMCRRRSPANARPPTKTTSDAAHAW